MHPAIFTSAISHNMPSSMKKRTTVKKQQPQQQQQPPSAPLPSLPATPIISDPNPTATAKISTIDFRTFIQHEKEGGRPERGT
jgi:hypothetical protein